MPHLESIRDKSHISAFLQDFSLAKRNLILFHGNIFFSDSVQSLWLEENAGILRFDATGQQSFGLNGTARHGNNKTWGVGKVTLGTLGVIVGTVANSSVRRPDSEASTVELITTSIPELGCFIHNLIESWENVISELHLSNSSSPRGSSTNSEAGNTLL